MGTERSCCSLKDHGWGEGGVPPSPRLPEEFQNLSSHFLSLGETVSGTKGNTRKCHWQMRSEIRKKNSVPAQLRPRGAVEAPGESVGGLGTMLCCKCGGERLPQSKCYSSAVAGEGSLRCDSPGEQCAGGSRGPRTSIKSQKKTWFLLIVSSK